jgi:hypothetical protein
LTPKNLPHREQTRVAARRPEKRDAAARRGKIDQGLEARATRAVDDHVKKSTRFRTRRFRPTGLGVIEATLGPEADRAGDFLRA